MLQTGDDANQEVANKVNEKQFKLLKGLVQDREVELDAFLNHYNAETLADLSQAYYQDAVKKLQEKNKEENNIR